MTNIRRVRTMVPYWDSMRPFSDMMDQFMRVAASSDAKMSAGFPLNISDENDKFVVEAALPGVDKKDVNMVFEDNVLTIAVDHKEEHNEEDKEKNYVHREISHSYMERQITFDQVNGDEITASLEDGMLKVVVPKLKEVEAAKRISIE